MALVPPPDGDEPPHQIETSPPNPTTPSSDPHQSTPDPHSPVQAPPSHAQEEAVQEPMVSSTSAVAGAIPAQTSASTTQKPTISSGQPSAPSILPLPAATTPTLVAGAPALEEDFEEEQVDWEESDDEEDIGDAEDEDSTEEQLLRQDRPASSTSPAKKSPSPRSGGFARAARPSTENAATGSSSTRPPLRPGSGDPARAGAGRPAKLKSVLVQPVRTDRHSSPPPHYSSARIWEHGEPSRVNEVQTGQVPPKWQEAKRKRWWRQGRAPLPSTADDDLKIPVESRAARAFRQRLAGRCFRCLATDHRIAQCRDPVRCLRCRGVGHLSRSCPSRQPQISAQLRSRLIFPPESIHNRVVFPQLHHHHHSLPTTPPNIHSRIDFPTLQHTVSKSNHSPPPSNPKMERNPGHALHHPRFLRSSSLGAWPSAATTIQHVSPVFQSVGPDPMLELGWGPGDKRGYQPAASLDDDPMLLEFQIAQSLAVKPGGATACPVDVCRGEARITFKPGVQLAIPEQTSKETRVADVVNNLEIDAASAAGRSDSQVLPVVDLATTASATAADNIVDEYAGLQGVEDIDETEDIDGCASFCRKMFRKVPEPLLPRPASPLVPDVQKKANKLSTRRCKRSMAPTRSSVRLAARPSPVPVAQRAQHKLMRDLDFINGPSRAPDAAITEYIDSFGQDLPEQAVETLRAATKMGNKKLGEALAALAAESGVAEMEVP